MKEKELLKRFLPEVTERFSAMKEQYKNELQIYIDSIVESGVCQDVDKCVGFACFRAVYKADRAEFLNRTGYSHNNAYAKLFMMAMKESGIYEMIKRKEN